MRLASLVDARSKNTCLAKIAGHSCAQRALERRATTRPMSDRERYLTASAWLLVQLEAMVM